MASADGGLYRGSNLTSSLANVSLTKSTAIRLPGVLRTPTPPPANTPPAIAAAAAAGSRDRSPPSGISMDRYRAKVEECVQLHLQLEELAHTKDSAEQRLDICHEEISQLRHAIDRLQSVLQLRNKEIALLHDSRRRRGVGSGAPAHVPLLQATVARSPKNVSVSQGEVSREISCTARESATTDQAVILEYIRVSCYLGCPTHPQLIQCLFEAAAGEALVATEPPLTYAQGSVLERLLTWSVSEDGSPDSEGGWEYSAFRRWACEHLRTLSVCFEDAFVGMSTLSDVLLHSLPSLTHLEVWRVSSDAALTKLADALMGATQVRVLSLPELAVGDEGLQALWRMTRTRDLMNAPRGAPLPNERSFTNSLALEIPTLDLSSCQIKDPLTLTQFHCSSAEAVLLPPTDCLTDSLLAELLQRCPQLHTLDISGCVRLTNSCVHHLNTAAPKLRVLAMEHCPHVHQLRLDHVEVLLSSLVHVNALTSNSLRVLPLPVQQRSIFNSLVAPRLAQISLHGLSIDAELMRPLSGCPVKVGGGKEGVHLTSITFSECTFTSDEVLTKFLTWQTGLQQLRFFHCKGLSNSCWTAKRGLPTFPALHTLELVNLRTLTDAALRELISACPALQQLNLHGAGWMHLTDISIRQIDQLVDLRELNLLGLNPDLVTAPVVTAVVRRLPNLQRLYHETAITTVCHNESIEGSVDDRPQQDCDGDTDSTSVQMSVIIERNDAEARWRAALRDYPLRLLRLQHHSALALWTDGARSTASYLSSATMGSTMSDTAFAMIRKLGHGANGVALSKATSADPSKLFPAIITRTMAAALAASAASATTMPMLCASPVPQQVSPSDMSLLDTAGMQNASSRSNASARHDAAAAAAALSASSSPPPPSSHLVELLEPERIDTSESIRVSPILQKDQLGPESPVSCSSSRSSEYSQSPSRESYPEGAAPGVKRSLVQCANAAAAVQVYPRRPVHRFPGINAASRPVATTVAAAAAAAAAAATQTPSVDDIAEAPMGPWEE